MSQARPGLGAHAQDDDEGDEADVEDDLAGGGARVRCAASTLRHMHPSCGRWAAQGMPPLKAHTLALARKASLKSERVS